MAGNKPSLTSDRDTRPTGSSNGPALRTGAREDHSMTVTETVSPATEAEALTQSAPLRSSAALTDSAAELLNAMAAMPAGHPSRAMMRDRAIEAWLPLARHLAHRYSGRGEPTDDLIQTATV